MHIPPRPLAAASRAVLLERHPTEYVNIRQRECPNRCCAGEVGTTGNVMGGTNKKPANFPVDPLKDSYYGPNHSNEGTMFAPYYFHRHDSGHQSTTSYEIDELERYDEGFHSNDSSTQSLLLWRKNQLRKQKNQLPCSNGAVLRLEQKSRYSLPWRSSNEDGTICTVSLRPKTRTISMSPENGGGRKCCLFPWLIGALLLLSISLLLWTVILLVEQQMELQRKLMDSQEPYGRLLRENLQKQNESSVQLMGMFNGSRIREGLHWIASKVHIAGTTEQLELMDKLAAEYRSLGFDVGAYEYSQVLLSMPDYASPNTIQSWNDRTMGWEQISSGIGGLPEDRQIDGELRKELENDPRMHVWWNAYAQNGTALGELVYANYGTQEDFETLDKVNISISGKIVLIRYGGIFRGDKVFLAERLGAVGVILYSDPFDYVPGNKTFPDDPWLPPSGSQRGTLYRETGDPETPLLPSLPYAHREFTEEQLRHSGILPNIPVTSIGYGDAQKLFARMDGPPVQWSRWAGGLPIIYRFSGSLLLRMDVSTRSHRASVKNVIAKMPGREEPDQWVLLGNHADAWTKGSIDPGTGTSIMLEMARVLANFSNITGWRPRRTIVFCQWDGEEFGLIGSTEWVEQNVRLLQSRAVAYINMDNFNGNTTLSIKAVPSLYRLIVDAASRVSQPVQNELENDRRTLLESWRFHNSRSTLPGDRSIPFFQLPHSGSDFQPFISYAGIPVADLRMENVPYSYMLYHTAYEVPWFNDHFLDPHSESSIALGRFWLEIVRQLADNMLIPFNVEDYGIALADYVAKADAQMKLIGIHHAIDDEFYSQKLQYLQEAIRNFQKVAIHFQRLIQAVNMGERTITLQQRQQLNHRLVALERCFIIDQGLNGGGRPAHRHAIFSAPEHEQNSGLALPILLDPAVQWFMANKSNDGIEAEEHLEKIRLAFSWLQYCVECAASMLRLDGIEFDD